MKQIDKPTTPRRLADLERAHGELRRRVNQLADLLHGGISAPSQLTKWLDQRVSFKVVGDSYQLHGNLKWFDRYSYGIDIQGNLRIFNKGNVISIGLAGKEG